jgi:hypothetical protein
MYFFGFATRWLLVTRAGDRFRKHALAAAFIAFSRYWVLGTAHRPLPFRQLATASTVPMTLSGRLLFLRIPDT